MPDINGMELIKSLPAPPIVVFTTASADYALEGYKLDAADYLLKPFGLMDFKRAANKVQKRYYLTNSKPAGNSEDSFQAQRDAVRNVINDPDNNMHQLVMDILRETDSEVLKATFTNIFLRDNVSISDTSVPQGTQGVNAQDMRNGVKYAELPRLVDANGMDAQQRTAWLGALEQMPQAQRNQFETAAQIAKRFGAAVQARTMQEGVQGSYQNGVIYIDPAAVDPVRQVLIHELTHHMETSGLYGRFSDAALRFVAEDMGADVDALRRTVIEDYAKAGITTRSPWASRRPAVRASVSWAPWSVSRRATRSSSM